MQAWSVPLEPRRTLHGQTLKVHKVRPPAPPTVLPCLSMPVASLPTSLCRPLQLGLTHTHSTLHPCTCIRQGFYESFRTATIRGPVKDRLLALAGSAAGGPPLKVFLTGE